MRLATGTTPKEGSSLELIRRVENGVAYLWASTWEAGPDGRMKRRVLHRVAPEPPSKPPATGDVEEAPAICWYMGRTVGNIAVYKQDLVGALPADHGDDAQLPCQFVHAGKFRHGAERWWCQNHQAYWGLKADIAESVNVGMRCANFSQPLWYVKNPKTIDLGKYAEVGVWCGMKSALSSKPIARGPPRIHVHIREATGGRKTLDEDYPALSLVVPRRKQMFADRGIKRINLTPPAAVDFVRALEDGVEMTTLACQKCKFPHLDLGDFSRRPHRKHTCANCGWDHTWSDGPAISTPLHQLRLETAGDLSTVPADEHLNLDKYSDYEFDVWPSTPAIVWTAKRPQKVGIHVHVFDGEKELVNETFGSVTFKGKSLSRKVLWKRMLGNTDLGDALASPQMM